MRKVVRVLLLVIGVLGLALTAFVAVKFAKGDYEVHTMTFPEFVQGQDKLDEFSYVRITEGQVDPSRKAVVYIKTGQDSQKPWATLYRMTGDIDLFTSMATPPVVVSFHSEDHTLLPDTQDGKPIDFVVYGYFSRGAGSDTYADAMQKLDVNPEKVVQVSYGAKPISVFKATFRGIISLLMVIAAVMMRGPKPLADVSA